MPYRIENYVYHHIDGLRKLSISENGTNVYTFTITATKTITAALAEWTSLVNASGDLSGTYLFTYSDSTSRVTLGRTDGGQFYYRLDGSLCAALGFTYNASLSSQAAAFAGTLQPAAICNPLSLHHDPPEASVEISKKIRRLGRTNVQTHYKASIVKCEALLLTEVADALFNGPMFSSRAKLMQDSASATGYSVTAPTGYLDTYGHTIDTISKIGYNDGHTRVRWIATVS